MGRSSLWRIRGGARAGKKKDLANRPAEQIPSQGPVSDARRFESIFQPKYFPPDAFNDKSSDRLNNASGDMFGNTADSETDLDQEIKSLDGLDAWALAVRYHEIKVKKSDKDRIRELRKLSARAVLERAQRVLGAIVRPVEQKTAPFPEIPYQAIQADIDIEETLENAPLPVITGELTQQDIWMTYRVRRPQPMILSVDTSLSMTGEKLALTAVALAVVLLEFPDDPIGIVAFENEAKTLKKPTERISVDQLVERFLDVPAHGYTHLEAGMQASLHMLAHEMPTGIGKSPSTILLTDGKFTAGKDPTYLAGRFPHLVVLKMGTERASYEFCRKLAVRGQGALREVGMLNSLPTAMYGVVKDVLRGRSVA